VGDLHERRNRVWPCIGEHGATPSDHLANLRDRRQVASSPLRRAPKRRRMTRWDLGRSIASRESHALARCCLDEGLDAPRNSVVGRRQGDDGGVRPGGPWVKMNGRLRPNQPPCRAATHKDFSKLVNAGSQRASRGPLLDHELRDVSGVSPSPEPRTRLMGVSGMQLMYLSAYRRAAQKNAATTLRQGHDQR
jgi:hypothetical protein